MIDLKNISKYSKEYGFLSIDEIIESPSTKKNRVAFLTDHSTMFASYDFIESCSNNGIKPVVGIIVAFKDDFDQRRELTLYAKNKEGFSALTRLTHKSISDKKYDKTFNIEDIYDLGKDVSIVVGKDFITDSEANDFLIMRKLKNSSKDGVFIGIPPTSTDNKNSVLGDNVEVIKRLKTLARFTKIPDDKMLAVNENRFRNASAYKYVKTKSDKVVTKDRVFNSDIIKSTDYIAADDYNKKVRFPIVDSFNQMLIENNKLFASSFEKYDLKVKEIYLPESENTLKGVLRDRYSSFMRDKIASKDFENYDEAKAFKKKYDDRIVTEIDLIEKLGFSDYFLIFEDFARNNPDRNFVLRGSSISSLTTHILGLSNIDPVENNLLFERFLNENRLKNLELPDIDVETDDVQEIVSYMQKKYGENRFVSLSTESIIKAKPQLDYAFDTIRKDILETPFRGDVQRIMPSTDYMNMLEIIKNNYTSKFNTFAEELEQNEDLKQYVSSNKNANILANLALSYEGQVTGINRVPANYAISPVDIDGVYSGFESFDSKNGFKYKTVELSGSNIEQFGMVKLDILSNIYLKRIDEFRRKYDIKVDFDNQDQNVYKMLSDGHTSTLNQIKSNTQSRLCKSVGVDSYSDIVNIIALIRPAVEQSKRLEYQRNKNGNYKSQNHIGHIIDETYGIIIFDEQVMKIAQDFGGLSPADSDEFRGALKSNNTGKLKMYYEDFKKNANSKGIKESETNGIINTLDDMAGKYTFSKAHSLAYTQLIYEQSYYKENYPAEYMSVFMNDNKERAEYISELSSRGIIILKIDINRSESDFKTRTHAGVKYVDYPISIKNKDFADAIISERNSNGNFKDIFDLMERMVDSQKTKPIIEMSDNEKTAMKVSMISGINELTSIGALDKLVNDNVLKALYDKLGDSVKRENNLSDNKNEIIRSIIDVTVSKNIGKLLNPFDSSDFEYSEMKDVQKTRNLVDYEKSFYGGNIDFIKEKPSRNEKTQRNNYRL